eukprot:COSAG01_NODE_3197_length_6430_cov_36.427263_5_plen_47_part_00
MGAKLVSQSEIAFWGRPSFWGCVHRLDLAFELWGGSAFFLPGKRGV